MTIKERLTLDESRIGKWWLDITDFSEHIFGDVVTKVEILCHQYYDYDEVDEEGALAAGTKIVNKLQERAVVEHINFDASVLRITFTNGNVVFIRNSEWCSVSTNDNL